MEKLKEVNLYNLIKIVAITTMIILTPLIILKRAIKKYVQCPVAKLIKAFNV